MALSVERLRTILVCLALLLVAVIAASFLYARWRLRHVAQDLPSRLGVQIQQSTRGFVLSKSERGRPLFTLHAARAIQFKSGGHIALHQVEIDLYDAGTGKADTISGEAFEYDPSSQVVRSRGEARIVLHAQPSGGGSARSEQTVRVVTHDLVFNQKTGITTCGGEVTFTTSDSSGQAFGAVYDSKLARLTLGSEIAFRTNLPAGPAVVDAAHAVYERNTGQIHLALPRFQSISGAGESTGAAQAATIFLRPDRSAERVHATGAVRLASSAGVTLRAPDMTLLLSDTSRPERAYFDGELDLLSGRGAERIKGDSEKGEVDFDGQGRATRTMLSGGVHLDQQIPASGGFVERTLASDQFTLHLLPAKVSQVELETADASGNAVFESRDSAANRPEQKTTLSAQQLHLKFAADNQIERMDGAGQTRLKSVAANGRSSLSTGDKLSVEFDEAAPAGTRLRAKSREKQSAAAAGVQVGGIREAIQTGNVVLQQGAGAGMSSAAAGQRFTATARRAEYQGKTNSVTLTGNPVIHNEDGLMRADRIRVDRTSGDMQGQGAVQATLLRGSFGAAGKTSTSTARDEPSILFGATEPVHVISDSVSLVHATGQAVFSGQARLWQGDDSIEAPTITVSQQSRTLTASGGAACARCVFGTFVSLPAQSHAKPDRSGSQPPLVLHVISKHLLYSDAQREAFFRGAVSVSGSLGSLTADSARILFSPAAQPPSPGVLGASAARTPADASGTQSSIEKMMASGTVRLLQPGRSAAGAQLVYTASDGAFVLTGTPAEPPKAIDADQGIVIGRVLTFSSPAQAIMVSGAPGRPSVTITTVRKK